jgi:predicted MFS family arabinose efflux permease
MSNTIFCCSRLIGQVVGVSLQYVATSKGELLAGKVVNGVAIGGFLSVGTTYASEVGRNL